MRRLRQHGARSKHEYVELGGNYRLDALQAAFLREKLPRLAAWLGERRAIAEAYSAELAGMAELRLPATLEGTEPAWAHYVVRVLGGAERRDALVRYLMERGVETAIYYPTPLHLQPVFAHLGYRRGDFPVAERWAREALALPLFPGLRAEERARVVDGVHSFFQR
ncbi:MAG: DegT/DnrJ/EryC1/StrS family aminotransferase [Polyangiaceae bacterium]